MIDGSKTERISFLETAACPPLLASDRPLRIVLTGGGTGGHVTPTLAVLEELRARGPVDPIWVGSAGGFERRAAAEHAVPYYAVSVGKLRRYFSLSTPVDAVRVPLGVVQAWRLLRVLRPHVVFSSGGFVGVPAVVAAARLGIPTLTHEQTAHPGLATRINARFCDVIALSFPETADSFGRQNQRVVVTGNPVRSFIILGDPLRAREHFALLGDRPLVYVTGGIQGATAINNVVGQALDCLLEEVEIIHQCGPNAANGDFTRLSDLAQRLPSHVRGRYHLVEVVGPELGDIYAAADLLIGRAGAGTVAELSAVGLPSILIPLPGAVEQWRNAEHLVKAGAAILLPQDRLSPTSLDVLLRELIKDRPRLAEMRRSAAGSSSVDAAKRVADLLLELATSVNYPTPHRSPRTDSRRE